MDADFRYDCALAAALVIMEMFDQAPGDPKHKLLANTIFAILHAMDVYEEKRRDRGVGFSNN